MTFTGTGLVSKTVILVNGVAVPSTYQSATTIVAQITAPAGFAGTQAVVARNPTPGGGSSSNFKLGTATLRISATDSDGSNTATARLGVPVNLTTVETDTMYASIGWTVQGPGTLVKSGTNWVNATYTPPQVMPADPVVTITADLANLPALKQSYTVTLINPIPTITSATPLLTGGTQTVAIGGLGFVPGTTVTANGTSYPTIFTNPTTLTMQLPVGAKATGKFVLQAHNPAPGGGSGPPFNDVVTPSSITLNETDPDGTNTGTVKLGVPVDMSAVVTGSLQTGVTWSETGGGSITSGGVYTLHSMPAASAITIHAVLTSNPAITATYTLTPINPVPAITASSPIIVPAGATTSVTLTGSGFVPSTVIEVNGATVPTTYISYSSIVAQLSPAANATGDLLLQASTSGNVGGTSEYLPVAVSSPVSATAAARLLDQTTFGPTTSLIQHVQQEGVAAWLTEQYNTPQTVLEVIPPTYPSYCTSSEDCFVSEWWRTVVTGNDQLRQRVALALSEMFVVSVDGSSGFAMQPYISTLSTDAFTNWYTIMNDVTLSPAMGNYLNMLNSGKATGTLIANENFARENMQLFNLGLDLLNQDGSEQLDPTGHPIPAYTETQVQAFARAFTGWTFAPQPGSQPSAYFTGTSNYNQPMSPVEIQHDESLKALLNGTTLPAGQTAEQDLAGALTNVFEHQNTPPFVCRQLIQHLVKGMPSPAYVWRVAGVFMNDGNGVRGNMQAVLTAIFTDPEAREGDDPAVMRDGHLREPILWLTGVVRGLGIVNVDPNNYWENFSSRTASLGEKPFASASVFNFFPPTYVIPGTRLNAPEFALENTASVIVRLNLANQVIFNTVSGFNVDLSATSPLGQIAVSQGPAALVNALSQLFLYGTMDASTAAAITTEISSVKDPAQQVSLAVYLTITSSEYKVTH